MPENLILLIVFLVLSLRPALPRYNVTWDVNVVLKYFKGLSPLESLSLLQISQKLAQF
jgi:hypothetical protein